MKLTSGSLVTHQFTTPGQQQECPRKVLRLSKFSFDALEVLQSSGDGDILTNEMLKDIPSVITIGVPRGYTLFFVVVDDVPRLGAPQQPPTYSANRRSGLHSSADLLHEWLNR